MGMALVALPGCSLVLDPSGFIGEGIDGGGVDGGNIDGGDLDGGNSGDADGGTCADMCGGTCVDLQNDPDHCGRCGTVCQPLEGCAGGACVPVTLGSLMGSEGKDSIRAIAVSPDGMVCVGGILTGSADWVSGLPGDATRPLFTTDRTGSAGFVICTPPGGGSRAWASVFEGTTQAAVTGLAIDAERVVVVGTFEGTLQTSAGIRAGAGGFDGFVAEFTLGGMASLVRVVGGSGNDSVNAVAISPLGTCIGGSFEGMLNLAGMPYASEGEDGFVECEVSTLPSAFVFSGPGFAQVRALTSDGTRLFVGGQFSGAVDPLGFTAMGPSDGFVLAFEEDRAMSQERQIGSVGEDSVRALAVTPGGDLVVGGSCSGGVPFPGIAMCNDAGSGFVVALGASSYSHVIASADGSASVRTVSVDRSSGAVLFGGEFRGDASFDGVGTLTGSGEADGFLWSLAPDGTAVDHFALGNTGEDAVMASAVGPMGNAFFAADFEGTVELPGTSLTSAMETPDSVFVRIPASRR